MIRFTHDNQIVELAPGARWSHRADAETYRDTPAESLWHLVERIQAGAPWREAVAARYATAYPWLHSIVTSPLRDRFFQQHPPAPASSVLDIGAGWGQIAVPLARNHQVTALEPTPERLAFIEAIARQEGVADSMRFVEADFLRVEFATRFDLACCIGVLEWVPKFSPGRPALETQIDFLARIRRLLTPDGRLVVGIENRLGLKYLLGAPDDHLATAGVGQYDAQLASQKWHALHGQDLRVFTYTRAELADMLARAGFGRLVFHAAFPDYKLPQVILPLGAETERFCRIGPWVPEHDGSCGAALPFQSELQSHYRSLGHLGIASDFCPSFFVEAFASPAPPPRCAAP